MSLYMLAYRHHGSSPSLSPPDVATAKHLATAAITDVRHDNATESHGAVARGVVNQPPTYRYLPHRIGHFIGSSACLIGREAIVVLAWSRPGRDTTPIQSSRVAPLLRIRYSYNVSAASTIGGRFSRTRCTNDPQRAAHLVVTGSSRAVQPSPYSHLFVAC